MSDFPNINGASDLVVALRGLPKIIEEIHAKWDEGMRAGKLLIALMDPSLKYRDDITAIHTAIAKAEADAAVAPPPAPLEVPKYLNLVDGKIYELISEDASTVTFRREGREKLAYLGRVEFDKRFQLLSAPAPLPHVRVPAELCDLTFAIQHNPRCPSPWLVRLPGKSGAIDMKPYRDLIGMVKHETTDRLGFGKTLEEAARAALDTSEGRP